jgi:chemotaxis signal transduction protein
MKTDVQAQSQVKGQVQSRVHGQAGSPEAMRSGISLRFVLSSGVCTVPLHRLHHLAGYASLSGEPEDYFLGWLAMRGEAVPVFDLNRVVCDQPTPEQFGSRVLVLKAGPESPTPFIGLLAAGATDTVLAGAGGARPFDLDSYLPMLYSMVPMAPPEPKFNP